MTQYTTCRPPHRRGRNAAASLLCLSLLASSAFGQPVERQPADADISTEMADALGLSSDQNVQDDEQDDEQDIGVVDMLKPTIFADPIFDRRSRSWDLIINPITIKQPDPKQLNTSIFTMEMDPFKFTDEPSVAPSEHPSALPTAMPSASPTAPPSSPPTLSPTNSPTITPMPTTNMWVSEPEPSNPDVGYFNYAPTSPRGPANWGSNVDASETSNAKYWNQWENYISSSLNKNRCDNDRQSPIDVSFAKSEGQCFEYHEIRHEPGEYSVQNPKVKAEILPSKLRIVFPQEFDEDCTESWTEQDYDPELDKVVCKDNIKGPSADIPKGWSYQMPVLHVDIKIPSEHYMEGKQYAAEYQINLIQDRKNGRGSPIVSIFFDLDPENVPNKALQVVLDRFQMEYDADLTKCEANTRKKRRLESALAEALSDAKDQDTWLDEPEAEEVKFQSHLRKTQRDLQQSSTVFDPWNSEIMTSIWFFGYEGSLTEPPCTEFVEWRIIDEPALISEEQLSQMRRLLFHHVDKDCKRTSTHYDGSVARPLQPYNDRLVHRCMCRDFIADNDRKRYGSNRCKWKDRDDMFGFDENVFTEEWYEEHHQYENGDHQLCKKFGDCDDWEEELAEREEAKQEAAASAPGPAPGPFPGGQWWWGNFGG